MNLKGTLPLLVLQTLAQEALHGYAIAQRIKARSEGVLDFKEGTLYPTLHALEEGGSIEANSVVVDGRIRHIYRLTDKGNKVLEAQTLEWGRIAGAVNSVLAGAR